LGTSKHRQIVHYAEKRERETRMFRLTTSIVMALAAATLLAACSSPPLGSVGQRSSQWINEPEVVTTTAPPVTVPKFSSAMNLQWSNDEIVTDNLADPEALIAEVFARREGDRFIQASRAEIAAVLQRVRFPADLPYGAEWVSSQLVIENSGELSDDPSAAFGIWSAEPYSRSRSVAQMAVLQVTNDKETATELAQGEGDVSCARFADEFTDQCDILDVSGKQVWRLSSAGGTTLIWFEGAYRYELYGRSFVAQDALVVMAAESVLLDELGTASS
jgi:hypothetical protein